MKSIEVLCATTYEKPFDLIKKMNIKGKIIITQQGNENKILVENNKKIIKTTTKGVGINRNIGLLAATGDILLFADDDVVYNENYEKEILKAYEKLPQADVIVFKMSIVKNNKEIRIIDHKTQKLRMFNSFKYGTYLISVKREALLQKNIYFSTLFGGGSLYGSGEDSKFLIDCFKNKLNVYTYDYNLGKNIDEKSSWFNGFNKKYFYDKGAFLACTFPKLKYILVIYFFIRFYNKVEMKKKELILLMLDGIKGYNKLISYDDFIKI